MYIAQLFFLLGNILGGKIKCLEVLSNGDCQKCADGFNIDNGICKENVFELMGNRELSNLVNCTIDHCLICRDSAFCIICEKNYIPNQGICIYSCLEGCENCGTEKCLSCVSGYSLDKSQTMCLECNEYCLICEDLKCLSCAQGFFLDSGKCKKCGENCLRCNSYLNCFLCYTGYFLNINSECEYCTENCQICFNSQNKCNKCINGYGVTVNDTCKRCKANCTYCETNTICQVCDQGFILSITGDCFYNKDSECALVNNDNKCIKCKDNFYLNEQNICEPCHKNCYWCNDLESCIECFDGYGLDEFGRCTKKCGENCLLCDYQGYCYKCINLFTINENFQCVPCTDPLCIICNQADFCLTCLSGYSTNLNGKCVKCAAYCSECDQDSLCLLCEPGYGVMLSGECFKCEIFCELCIEGQCIECIKKYGLSSEGCLPCPDNCERCKRGFCFECMPGFGIDDKGSCLECQTQTCLTCDLHKFCVNCRAGYYLNDMSDCEPCEGNCLECSSKNFCTKCAQWFFLSNGLCIQNPAFCYSASSPSSCISPSLGYTINSSNLPQSCSIPCNSCPLSFNCKNCPISYYLNTNSTCSHCLEHCYSCIGSYCINCFPGFYNNKGICIKCPRFCERCENSTNCTFFKPHFSYGSNGDTVFCGINCISCLDNKCAICKTGFFISDRECFPCSIFCLRCLNYSKCLECILGFEINSSGSCQPKTWGCEKPGKNPQKCSRCIPGLILNSSKLCSFCQNGCISCKNTSTCSKCHNSYSLTSSQSCEKQKKSNKFSLLAYTITLSIFAFLIFLTFLVWFILDWKKNTPKELKL